LKLLVDQFRRLWPNVKIVLRADSGFCRWRMLRWCDRHQVDYIVGLAKNAVLKRRLQPWMEAAARQFAGSQQSQRLFTAFEYGAETWDRPRRILGKAEHNSHGPNPRFVVTSLAGDPQELYEHLYCQRGEMENRIKEQQLDLFADRTSCHRFLANQLRLLLSSAAYVLLESLRRLGLPATELARAQVGTIRLKLLKIGARVTWSVRRVALHLATGYPLKHLFERIVRRLGESPLCPT
jgi:hypothetical protein